MRYEAEMLAGKPVTEAMDFRVKRDAEMLAAGGVIPTLAIVRVGKREDDISYERSVCKRAEAVGVAVRKISLPDDVPQEKLLASIEEINGDGLLHGALILRPLPAHIDDLAVCKSLAPKKDVDGITDESLASVFAGRSGGFFPCTARACMEILDFYGIDPAGKRAVVVGRSLVVGKPVAMMLLSRNATVTLCHTKTVDLPSVCREAEILVVSAGKAKMIGEEHIAPGQVIIDVGINLSSDGKLCGDVDFEAAIRTAGAITPVPGGVGTVTTGLLLKNTVKAARTYSASAV